MHAAIITGKQRVELQSFPEPEAVPGSAVIDVRLCGICGTDVHAFHSGDPYAPQGCGHEWMGIVREVGDGVESVAPGQRVTIAISPACGTCPECRRGHLDACRTAIHWIVADPRASQHGGYAPAIRVSASRLAVVPESLTDEAAAQIEPATVAFHGVRTSHLRLGDVAVVQGAGPIGLFTLQWVRAAGASHVVVVEKAPVRAALAARLGADLVVAPGKEAKDAVRSLTGGEGADIVFECAGRPEAIQMGVDLVRRRGSVAIIGLADRDATITPGVWITKQVSVTCALAYWPEEFTQSMAMLAAGRVVAEPLHTRTVGLSELADAMQELGTSPADVKVLVDPNR